MNAKSDDASPFISPRELAMRWQCSRSSADRIVRRAALQRVCLGTGRRGMVRYIREEILQFERTRAITSGT